MSRPADIAIVGGGPVGLCAALVLQHSGRRVEVIEATKSGTPEPGGLNARSIALSHTSVQIFRALGIWPELERRAAPIHSIHISSRGRWGVTRLHAQEYDLAALGYVIESSALNECLLEAVSASKAIKLRDEAEFESITENGQVEIGYRRKQRRQRIEARIALIADGARSKTRDTLGIEHRVVDYGQSVVICNVQMSSPRANWAYERFTPKGPLAMLPLGEKRYACVWTLDPDLAAEIGSSDDAAFMQALQDCFGMRLGYIEKIGQRFSFPIQRVEADRLCQGRSLLIGNAANALHPVAGQSFNLSLRDIASLHELLDEGPLDALDDDNVATMMEAYAAARKREQRRVIGYGDGLVSVFSNQLPLLDHLRAAGLSALDLIPPLKTEAAFAGMGLTFDGNRLLRGHL